MADGDLEDVRLGDDGVARCRWAYNHPALLRYHDDEWSRPVLAERDLYERLVLKGFQAGLSCLIVLQKRDALRRAFGGFWPETVAAFSDETLAAMAQNPAVIRNQSKIHAARANARACLAIRGRGGVSPLVWSHRPPVGADRSEQLLAARALTADLRSAGFRFVGPTSVLAFMEAAGVIDAHGPGCAAGEQARRAA